MSPARSHCLGLLLGGLLAAGLLSPVPVAAQPAQPAITVPSAGELAELLRREPFSLQSWPAWRARLLSWVRDSSHQTDEVFEAAQAFVKSQANAAGQLSGPLGSDALAWYLLGSILLYEPTPDGNPATAAVRAEAALRRSLGLDPTFARAHRNLALALMVQNAPGKQLLIAQEMREAKQLDPTLRLKGLPGQAALRRQKFSEAETLFRKAMMEEPDDVNNARGLAQSILSDSARTGPRTDAVRQLRDCFPNDGVLACLYAVALAIEKRWRESSQALKEARKLGVDPSRVLSAKLVADIEAQAAPGYLEKFAWALGAFAAFYAAVMFLMTLAGVILASLTRGSGALELLGDDADSLVAAGQVVRTRHESMLTTLYGLALIAGLILFYLAIPFIVAGLLAGTGVLLYLIFSLGRIPIKLVALVVVVGFGGAWAVLKSLFASPGKGSFGLAKTEEECPRLHDLLARVARRVDTEPVDAVYLAPGSAIGVHQEGLGPFGVFGVKRRVLTLGLSTLRFLTVDELKAILAHEYAHFSHQDTFYSRFIYQVRLSIQEALKGMAESGGHVNYINPFYWFLFLYYKSYSVLAAGFSRSREFLADRMASSLYGSDVFASALTKVCTDGALFEMTIYNHIGALLQEGKAFVNMYESFRTFRDEGLEQADREQLYQKLLDENASLLADHPTFGERIAAVEDLPPARRKNAAPALSLFENPEEIEKELTDFLTGYIQYLHEMQARAAS